MIQLPDAFQGHDLTGWWAASSKKVRRVVARLDILEISHNGGNSFRLENLTLGGFVIDAPMNICIAKANELAKQLGKGFGTEDGWAPAPIGYSADPGWQPIEEAPKKTCTVIGFNRKDGFLGDCYNVSPGVFYRSSRHPVTLTHWRPLPAPPEAKQ